MNARTIVTILLIMTLPPVWAQEQKLTIEESVAIGLEHSKTLHSSQKKFDYAEAKAGEVSAGLYPSLKLSASYQKLSDVPPFKIPIPGAPVDFPVILNSYTTKATVQQPIFTGWKMQSTANSAEYSAEASRSDVERDKSELIYSIKSAYWNLYRAKEIERLSDNYVHQIGAHLNDVESMFKQGMATTNDVLKVKVQQSNASLLQVDARNNVKVAMLFFNSTMGIPLTTQVEIGSKLTSMTKEFPGAEQLLTQAATGRSDVKAMEWRVRAAESGVTAAKAGWSPQIFLTGNYYYARPNQRIFPAVDQFKDTWDVGVSLQFDIWNNLTTVYQTTAAQSQFEQTQDALASLKDGVTLEVTQSYLAFNQAKEKIRLSQLGVEQANENLRITQEKFKSGLTTNSEMIDAEVAQLQAELQLTQSFVDYELAQAKLEKAVGGGGGSVISDKL